MPYNNIMNNYGSQSNNPEIAGVHNYNSLSRDYPAVGGTSSLPEAPPPSYEASVANPSSFNNDVVG